MDLVLVWKVSAERSIWTDMAILTHPFVSDSLIGVISRDS